MFKRLIGWLFPKRARPEVKPAPVQYSSVRTVAVPPTLGAVERGIVFSISPGAAPTWAMLACPCGCRAVITLSLQHVHRPHWKLSVDQSGLPSLWPSVWRTQGCHSHFWLRHGRVHWAMH